MSVIATIGMLDGVHRGHIHLLEQLLAEAHKHNLHPVVFTFPEHPLAVINPDNAPKLLTLADEKIELIRSFSPEIKVVVNKFDSTLRNKSAGQFLSEIRDAFSVKALLCGFNNHIGSDRMSGEKLSDVAKQTGVDVLFATELPTDKSSSTIIRKALASNDMETANRLLGYNYSVAGTVVAGKQLGRTIGFPTANLSVDKSKLIPATGVYACRATVEETEYPAMMNIGHRPTVDTADSQISIEAHIIGTPENFVIYGKDMKLEFLQFMRPEQKFNSVEELKKQLEKDREKSVLIEHHAV